MILSMTGFGDAQLEQGELAFHVEVRSVNNRYLKTNVRLEEEFAFLEPVLEQLLRDRITRGTVTLRLRVKNLSASAAQAVNFAAIAQYVSQLRAAGGDDPRFTLDLATLAMLPGVCQPTELSEAQRESAQTAALRTATAAVEALVRMRTTEGRALAEDLRRQADSVRQHVERVRDRAPNVAEDHRRRLAARVAALVSESGAALAEDAILREVAIFAERSDISEEITRLKSHVEQFLECLVSGERSGRKLEFIAQEMHREANTIASKASDVEIGRHVIEMKGAIDRIKEQVANVE